MRSQTCVGKQSFAQTIYRYLVYIYRYSIALTKGERPKRRPLNSLRWPIHVINSVDNTSDLLTLKFEKLSTLDCLWYFVFRFF